MISVFTFPLFSQLTTVTHVYASIGLIVVMVSVLPVFIKLGPSLSMALQLGLLAPVGLGAYLIFMSRYSKGCSCVAVLYSQ